MDNLMGLHDFVVVFVVFFSFYGRQKIIKCLFSILICYYEFPLKQVQICKSVIFNK